MNNSAPSAGELLALNGKLRIRIADVLAHVYFNEGDVVLVGGSLMDGFGSSTSDLDIYVFSDMPPKMDSFPAHRHHRYVSENGVLHSVTDYMGSTGMILDTQYRTMDQVRAFQDIAKADFAKASRRTKILLNKREVQDQKVIYRLYHAVPLAGHEKFKRLMQEGLSREQFCYVLFRNVAGHYPLFNDVAGAWRDADLLMACERARTFMSWIALGLTHMFGNTNPAIKWVFRALEMLPAEHQHLAVRYRELMARGLGGSEDMRRLIMDCIHLADEFFDATRGLLDSTPYFLGIEDSERITREEIDGYRTWHRDLTREFAIRCRLFRSGLPPLIEFLPDTESEQLSHFLDHSDLRPRHLIH